MAFPFAASLYGSNARKFACVLATVLLFVLAGCSSGGQTSSSTSVGFTPTPDFTLTTGTSSLSLTEGGSYTASFVAGSINGFTGTISVSLSGLPTGVTANPSTLSLSAAGSQTITFSAASSAPAVSNATITVQATSGSITHSVNISITVLGPPSFTLSVQPSSLTLNTSTSSTFQLSATGVNGFTGDVTVNISGLPTGVTASQARIYVFANTSTTITLTASATASGSSTIQFNGSSGSLTASTSLALTVSTMPDFTISSGIFTAAAAYQSTTEPITVSTTGLNGFTAPINFSFSGLPTGVTASPATFTLKPGSFQTVVFTAALNAPPETNAEIVLQGVSGSLTHTTQFNFIVFPVNLNLSAQPTVVTVPAGSSALAEVQILGTSGSTQGSIAFQITGLPAGVTASPSSATFSGIGASQDVIFSAGTGATGGTAKLTATFGSAASSTNLAINIGPAQSITPIPLTSRSKLVRTDANAEFLGYPPPNWTVYDSATKRFFSSDYGLGRINVVDETTETVVASLNVPGAFGIDLAPDNSVLYVGTLAGDLYLVDPVNLVVTKRYLSGSIGTSGFAANAVYALANGQLLLQPYFLVPGYSFVDGNYAPAIWNPSTNAVTQLSSLSPNRDTCSQSFEFGVLTSGRTRYLMTPTLTSEGSSNLCSIDLSTQATVVSPTLQSGSYSSLSTLAVSPDGNTVAVFDGTTIWVLDAATLAIKNSFSATTVSQTTFNYPNMVIGPDNQTLYLTGSPNFNFVYVYKLTTGQETGWLPSIQAFLTSNSAPIIQAISQNGLLAGVIDQGFGLIDTTQVKPLPAGVPFAPSPLSPTYGPVQGGTDVSWMESNYGFSNATKLGSIYFGGVAATGISSSTVLGDLLYATTSAGKAGPVDVITLTTDGGEQYIPEGYSYGPWVVENTTTYATAEGGGPASLYGYGFGPNYAVGLATRLAGMPAGLQMTVGGQPATVTGYYPEAFQLTGYNQEPFPLEGVEYTMPSGTAGTSSDILVTDSAGSTTVKAGITYLPAIQSFPISGQLLDGIYDPHRDVYYFSDVSQVRVFSRTQGKWLNPIPIPAPPGAYGAQRLFGLALSPDGSKLAVADAGAIAVYVLDPDTPTSIQSFALASQISPISQYAITATPSGVTITNSGQVWFATYDQNGDGAPFLYALNTTTGKISIAGTPTYPQNEGNYPFGRLPMTADGSKFYFVNEGSIAYITTSTGALTYCKSCGDLSEGGYDVILSANQTTLYADGLLLDGLLNLQGFETLTDRESFDANYIYGATLSPDGTLLFQPGAQSIDVFDGRTGAFRARVSLPVPLSQNYRALVGDTKDNVQIAITGATGNGIAVIDLSSLQEPTALPYLEGAAHTALASPAATTDVAPIRISAAGPLRATRHHRWHYNAKLARPPAPA